MDAFPLSSCTAGGNGRTVFMFGNDHLKEDLTPVFQIHVHGTHRPDLDHYLVQPVKVEWAPVSVIQFHTPAQPYLRKISEQFEVKLTARDSSERFIGKVWDFEYVLHKRKAAEGKENCQYGNLGKEENGEDCWKGGMGWDNKGTITDMDIRGNRPRDCIFCGGILD